MPRPTGGKQSFGFLEGKFPMTNSELRFIKIPDTPEATQVLEQLQRTRNGLLGMLTSEIRTPITVISGYAEVMLKNSMGDLNQEQRKGLTVIRERAQQIIQILNDVLNSLWHEKVLNDRELCILQTDICPILTQAASAQKAVKIETDTPAETPVYIWCEPGFIRMIISDVIHSFRSATDPPFGLSGKESPIVLRVSQCPDWVVIRIENNDLVLQNNSVEEIFPYAYWIYPLSFYQFFLRLHGGDMALESKDGVGTVVSIRLPNCPEPPAASLPEMSHEAQ